MSVAQFSSPCHAVHPRREKIFGAGRPGPLDHETKIRIMPRARGLVRRTQKGKHYGAITAKALDVLLWGFHNAKSRLCFPSYAGDSHPREMRALKCRPKLSRRWRRQGGPRSLLARQDRCLQGISGHYAWFGENQRSIHAGMRVNQRRGSAFPSNMENVLMINARQNS